MNREEATPDIAELFADGTAIDEAIGDAVEEALRMHKRAGNPVCEWRDGKVVWIPADQIEVSDEAS